MEMPLPRLGVRFAVLFDEVWQLSFFACFFKVHRGFLLLPVDLRANYEHHIPKRHFFSYCDL
jgi:hypothetical protein